MLDLGFLPDVITLLSKTPETRQTMLFSATMPAAIVALARTHMRHPMNIRAESSYDTTMVPATAQFIYLAHDLDKPEIIGRHPAGRGRREDHRLHPHQASGAARRRRPRRARLQRLAAARRHGAGRAREGARQVPRGQDPRARRHRRRRPRHRRARRLPRHQLHLPRGRQDLRPPHRPHRPRGRLGHRDHVRRLGRPAPLEDDQQDARPALPGAAGDLLDLRHLFHDQGIPEGTKGRIVDPAPQLQRRIARRASAPVRRSGRGSGRSDSGPARTGSRLGRQRPRRSPATPRVVATAAAAVPAPAADPRWRRRRADPGHLFLRAGFFVFGREARSTRFTATAR